MNDSTNDSYDMMAHHSFPGDSDDWFVDSGVIHHMCCNKDSFTIYHLLNLSKPIYLGESSVVNAYSMGMIRIGDKVNLLNVLHVPDLDINPPSVDKVLQHDHNVLFSGDGCTIKQGCKNIIEAFRVGNLFRVNGKNLFIPNYTNYCRGTDCPHCSLGVWEWPARTLSAARSSDRAS